MSNYFQKVFFDENGKSQRIKNLKIWGKILGEWKKVRTGTLAVISNKVYFKEKNILCLFYRPRAKGTGPVRSYF